MMLVVPQPNFQQPGRCMPGKKCSTVVDLSCSRMDAAMLQGQSITCQCRNANRSLQQDGLCIWLALRSLCVMQVCALEQSGAGGQSGAAYSGHNCPVACCRSLWRVLSWPATGQRLLSQVTHIYHSTQACSLISNKHSLPTGFHHKKGFSGCEQLLAVHNTGTKCMMMWVDWQLFD